MAQTPSLALRPVSAYPRAILGLVWNGVFPRVIFW
jgi:hypothetical protein